MNKLSKSRFLLIAVMGMTLAGCQQPENPTDTSEAAPTSETTEEASSSIDPNAPHLELAIEASTIPNGGNFFDFCRPSVKYVEKDAEPEEVYNYTNKTKYEITKKGGDGTVYSAGDALEAGDYTCKVSYRKGKKYSATINFKVKEVAPIEASDGNGYKQYATEDFAGYTYKDYRYIDTLAGGSTPSQGNTKILVIPVEFNNITFEGSGFSADLVHDVLNEAFFGDTEDTPWESLASYYRKSSYGKQNITGMVTPIYKYPVNDSDANITSNISREIAVAAVDYFRTEGTFIPYDYDSDHDGYIDGIEIVYITSRPTPGATGTDSNDTWWNYTTNCSSGPNKTTPTPHRMFWSRWDYLTNSYYGASEKGIAVNGKKVDPHTIIHETGHMQGAPDYYSYWKTESGQGQEGPAGCVDMMDQNVGDHNAYTKMHYGWVAPKVIDGSADNFTLTLHSFAETGEFVIVRDTVEDLWNETPFDEYLVLQYYTPTNLNEMDCHGYKEWLDGIDSAGRTVYGHAGTYAHPGLQVFHADGRVVSYQGTMVNGVKQNDQKWAYTDDPHTTSYVNDTTYGEEARRVHSNTGGEEPGRSCQVPDSIGALAMGTNIRELSILTPSGTGSFMGSTYYSNFGYMTNLFGLNGVDLDGWQGDPTVDSGEGKFGGSYYSNYNMSDVFPNIYKWNDGSTFNWAFEVIEQTMDSITLHFINNRANVA